MIGRMAITLLMLSLVLALPASAVAGDLDGVLRRDDDATEVMVLSDGGDDDTNDNTNSGFTSGVNSNDATGSGHTAVSWDRDRSRGDLTRDWTRDGGDRTRDRTGNHTNDRSRHDTR